MGGSNATATSEKAKHSDIDQKGSHRTLHPEDSKKKEESMDEWWAKIKKEHEESKNKNITMNPGWQNPFSSKLMITKESLVKKSKDDGKKITKQTTISK